MSCFWVVCPVQQVIHRNLVEIRQAYQNGCGDIDIAPFIVAVNPLAAKQNFAHLGLRHILVLPEGPDPMVHSSSPQPLQTAAAWTKTRRPICQYARLCPGITAVFIIDSEKFAIDF